MLCLIFFTSDPIGTFMSLAKFKSSYYTLITRIPLLRNTTPQIRMHYYLGYNPPAFDQGLNNKDIKKQEHIENLLHTSIITRRLDCIKQLVNYAHEVIPRDSKTEPSKCSGKLYFNDISYLPKLYSLLKHAEKRKHMEIRDYMLSLSITNAFKKKDFYTVDQLLEKGQVTINYNNGDIAKTILLNNEDSTKDTPIDLLKDLVEKYGLDVHIDNNFLFRQKKQNIDTMIYLISKRKHGFLDHDAQIIREALIPHLLNYVDEQQWKKVDTIMQLSKDNPDLKIKDHTLIPQDTKHTSTGKMILDRITNALKETEWDIVSKLLDLGIINANYDNGAIAKKILLNNDDSTKDAPIDLLKDLMENIASTFT